MILVVVQAGQADRVSEGLRAGIGLGLRGDEVAVVLTGPAAAFAGGAGDARIARALGTLAELGRPAEVVEGESALAARVRAARAVEVWTGEPGSRSEPRRLLVGDSEIEIWRCPPRFRAPRPERDGAATDRAATDRAATDRAATDRAATDGAATDGAATDRAAIDRAAIDRADLVAQILGSDGPAVLW